MNPLDLGQIQLHLAGTIVQGPQGPQGKDGVRGPEGPAGPVGPMGPQGPAGGGGNGTGTQGPIGPMGPPGIDGINGAVGPQGPIGPKGDKGDKGNTGTAGSAGTPGAPGIDGVDGLNGEKGAKGDKGDTGTAGTNGLKGDKGDIGAPGLKGDPGNDGAKGAKGDKGDKGDTGAAGTGLNNRGSWAASTFNPGDYVFAAGSTAPTSMWILSGNAPYASSTQPNTDASHWIEFEAPAGAAGTNGTNGTNGIDGKNVELRKTVSAIQWRLDGGTWADIVLLSEITGPQGTPGLKGDKGDTGAAGTNGTNGTDGEAGAKGDPGSAGSPGTPGAPGVNGNTIHTVTAAPDASLGVNGDYAYNGTTSLMYGPKAAGAWPTGKSLKGANGSAGEAGVGAKWLSGAGAPTTAGVAGDMYLNTVTGDIYGPKAGTVWGPVVTTVKGTKGDKGDKGDPGVGGGGALPVGGTLGQVLTKASATDGDATWATPAAGGGGGGSAPLTDVRSASMNNNSTTLVKALGVAGLTSGKTYRVRILAHTMPSSPSVGIAIGFGGTFGASKIIMTARYLTAADTMSSKFMSEKGVTYTFPTSAQGSPHGCPLIIEGFIMCVGAGTFELHIGAVAAWEYWAFEAGSNLTVEAVTTTV